eukprot:5068250-Pyramimonas_sp.AAC.1
MNLHYTYGVPWLVDAAAPKGAPLPDGPALAFREDVPWDSADKLLKVARAETAAGRRGGLLLSSSPCLLAPSLSAHRSLKVLISGCPGMRTFNDRRAPMSAHSAPPPPCPSRASQVKKTTNEKGFLDK